MKDISSLLEEFKVVKGPKKLDRGQVEYLKLKNSEDNHNRLIEMLSKNIKASEYLRCEINKSNDPNEIVDKALKCISLLAGDELFYVNNIKKVKGKGDTKC